MSVTLAELRTSLQAMGYGTDTVSVQNSMLNDAYRDVCSQERWPFLESIATFVMTSGTSKYQITTEVPDLAEVDSIRVYQNANDQSSYYIPENCEPETIEDLIWNNPLDVGPPYKWSMYAGNFIFYPVPDQAYTVQVNYVKTVPDLVADTDMIVCPDQFQQVIVWGAIKLMTFRTRDIYSYQTAQGEYETRLRRMKEAYLLRQRQNSSKVKSSGVWQTRRPYPWTWW